MERTKKIVIWGVTFVSKFVTYVISIFKGALYLSIMSSKKTLTWDTYLSKTLGCWQGKNAGGTLGGPDEGKLGPLNLSWYPVIKKGGIPNDDLEIQLVWLHALETRGISLTSEDLSMEWLDHYLPNWDEYGFAKTNLRKGILPPLSGSFNNWFHRSMGCPIRSEIWACVAPGLPFEAAKMAREDAVVDHSEESVYAEILFAVIESAAFLEKDREILIDLGLAAIPDLSETSKAVQVMRKAWQQTKNWQYTRRAILQAVGDDANFTDAPQNIAFTLLGWYSSPNDFGKAICDAVNCGYDTDCTGATLGAILGIVKGKEGLPAKWMKPLGNEIAIDTQRTRIQDAPKTVEELTLRTAALATAFFAGRGMSFGDGQKLTLALPTTKELRTQVRNAGLWNIEPNSIERKCPHARVKVVYKNGPYLVAGKTSVVELNITNLTERQLVGPVKIKGFEENSLSLEQSHFSLNIAPGNTTRITVRVKLKKSWPLLAHQEFVVGILAEGISPWTFPVSVLRPMVWQFEYKKTFSLKGLKAPPTKIKGISTNVFTNKLPLKKQGLVLGQTKVFNPAKKNRAIRVCCPSHCSVKIWKNAELIVNNPGSDNLRPSYHYNAEHHYGHTFLAPGWNELVGAWEVSGQVEKSETHFFITSPDGTGWGDLVFSA